MTAKTNRQTIEQFVDVGEEFDYINCYSSSYNIRFDYLCNFVLDSYNHYMRQGVDKKQAKVTALLNMVEYCNKVAYKRAF